VTTDRSPLPGSDRVRVLTIVPLDPEDLPIGGIASFIRGFVKFAPADFELGMIGISGSRAPWQTCRVELEGRPIQLIPALRAHTRRRTVVPLALRFATSLARNRKRLPSDPWVRAFHRPGTDRAVPAGSPMWRVVHLGIDDLRTPQGESRWRRIPLLLAAVERRSFERMDRVWVVNRAVTEAYRTRFPEMADRFHFLPNWVDQTVFHPEPPARAAELRAALRAEIRAPGDAPVVLYAGRLDRQKQPLLLARAFASYRDRVPHAYLVIAGRGALAEATRTELAAAGVLEAARFVGAVSRARLAELMAAADLLAITSAFETGPTVGLEALACGLPVVTTPVGEVARTVERTGAGRVSDAATPEALADGFAWVTSQPRAHLRDVSVSAAVPFLAERVLEPLYQHNRLLARRLPPHRQGEDARMPPA
jgi:glycosyltransferase involved in cell wall biosynthesis